MKLPDTFHIGVDFKRCDECEYKREARFRDDLLVTSGMRVAYMHDANIIDIPKGTEGEHELAMFIANNVDYYLVVEPGNFDIFIETAIKSEYGRK